MNLAMIRTLFQELNNKGYIPSRRKGSTGIGYTLEAELGLTESNISLPDFGSIELKSMRSGTRRLITLFTLNRTAWQPSAKDVIRRFGYWDSERKRYALYCAVKNRPNPQDLFLSIDNDQLFVKSTSGDVAGSWSLELVRDKIIEKLQALIVVIADTKKINEQEHFWYKSAKILNGFNYEMFFEQLKIGQAIIDIRMHIREDGSVRNHGTGFRIPFPVLEKLYVNSIPLI